MTDRAAAPTLTHEMAIYEGEDQFLSVAVPFVSAGVDAGEVVLVNLDQDSTDLLRREVGEFDSARFGDQSIYQHPMTALASWQRRVQHEIADGAPGVRSLGAVDFAASDIRWRDWIRYESLINYVCADFPLHGLCAYDREELTPEVAHGLRLAHPTVYDEAARRSDNDEYVEPATLLGMDEYALPPDWVTRQPPDLEMDELGDVGSLHLDINLATIGTDLHRQVVIDFGRAVAEVATNALRHGREPYRLRLWTTSDEMLCAVTDHGTGIPDPLAGYRLPHLEPEAATGVGLWAARQLCDHLAYRQGEDGFTVWVSAGREP